MRICEANFTAFLWTIQVTKMCFAVWFLALLYSAFPWSFSGFPLAPLKIAKYLFWSLLLDLQVSVLLLLQILLFLCRSSSFVFYILFLLVCGLFWSKHVITIVLTSFVHLILVFLLMFSAFISWLGTTLELKPHILFVLFCAITPHDSFYLLLGCK